MERRDLQYCSKAKYLFGFSLVEMLIVLVLICLIASTAAPYFQHYQQKQHIKETLRSIKYLLLDARMTAYKVQSAVVINFEETYCTAFVDNGDGIGGIAKDWLQQRGEQTIGAYTAPAGITMSNNFPKKDQFRFRNKVGVTPGTITILHNGREAGKVIVNVTGRTRIEM